MWQTKTIVGLLMMVGLLNPNDDSEEEDSDASMSRGEEEVTRFALTVSFFPVRTRISIVMQHANELLDPDSRILPRWKLVSQSRV